MTLMIEPLAGNVKVLHGYVDPETGEMLGPGATYIGLGTVVAQERDISTFLVSSTREEVQIGDRVLPTEQRRVESTFFPSAPDSQIKGQIISVFGGVTQVGQFDVVVINRGSREGVEVGNVLAIYKRGALARDRIARDTVQLPSERAGLMMLFRVFEKLSYGLVLATERPLSITDEVTPPKSKKKYGPPSSSKSVTGPPPPLSSGGSIRISS